MVWWKRRRRRTYYSVPRKRPSIISSSWAKMPLNASADRLEKIAGFWMRDVRVDNSSGVLLVIESTSKTPIARAKARGPGLQNI